MSTLAICALIALALFCLLPGVLATIIESLPATVPLMIIFGLCALMHWMNQSQQPESKTTTAVAEAQEETIDYFAPNGELVTSEYKDGYVYPWMYRMQGPDRWVEWVHDEDTMHPEDSVKDDGGEWTAEDEKYFVLSTYQLETSRSLNLWRKHLASCKKKERLTKH